MANPVKAIPDGYHNVTPYLVIKGAAAAIDFYKTGFWRDRSDAHAAAGWEDRACGVEIRQLARHDGR